MKAKWIRIAAMLVMTIPIIALTAAYAAEESGRIIVSEKPNAIEESDDEIIVSEEPAIPVAPGQISTFDRGAANSIRKGHFATFNARYNNRWRANINRKDGKVRILYGSQSKSYTGGAEEVTRGFLIDAHALFGMKDDLEDLRTKRINRSFKRHHVKLQQTYDGVSVRGAFVLVHSNEGGQVTMVQNDYQENLTVDNRRLASREDAVRIAFNDLEAEIGNGAVIYDATPREMVAPHGDLHLFIWKITIPTQNPIGFWVYHIDAESSEIIYKANELNSLRNGSGKVYKSDRKWHKGKINRAALANMFTPAEGVAGGWLYGWHADIYDDNQNDPFAPDYRFIYNPNIPTEKPWFDATTAYYSLNRLWGWWQKNVLKKYGPGTPDYFYTLPIPAIVNVDDFCNAVYTPDLGGGIPGFAFGNEGSCSPSSEDIVLDKTVVSHEYAHAMMDWCGFDTQFGGELHQYGRAMGEGNSDWFAYLFTKSVLLGNVAWDWSEDGYLRNLNNTMVYPDDVDEPSLGVPEEHYTGQIWGGYLYDLSQGLKSMTIFGTAESTALKYVYQGFYYFSPEGGHRPFEPDFYDAMYAQILAEQDLYNGKYKNSAKAWGCMASRGINAVIRPTYTHSSNYFGTGSPGGDEVAYFAWSFPQVKRIKTSGRILKAFDTNEFPIIVSAEGRTLKVIVKAATGTMEPSVELFTTSAEYVASGTSNGKKALLTMTDILPGEYVIVLSANQGGYKIDIKVK